MPAGQSYSPMINGKNYDWVNIECVILGVSVIGITEINYERSRDSVNNYGAGQEPVGYGNKNFEYSCDLSLFLEEIQALTKVAPNNSILEIPPFTITIIFSGDGVNFSTHKLKNVRFTKDVMNAKQNDSVFVMKIPIAYAGLTKVVS